MVRFASLKDLKTIEADMPWPDSQPATLRSTSFSRRPRTGTAR